MELEAFHGTLGALDDPESVEAITKVMEGGIEAFDRRGEFYHSES